MNRTVHSLSLAVRRVRTRYAPDDRVTIFDVTVDHSTTIPTIRGVVSESSLRKRVLAAARNVSDDFDTAIRVLDGSQRTVTVSIAPVRNGPSADAEQLTQVLRGAAVTAYEQHDREADHENRMEWVRVRVPDGYVGWIESAHLDDVVAISPEYVIRRRTDAGSMILHAGTDIAIETIDDDWASGRLRSGEAIEIQADAVTRPKRLTGDEAVEVAKQFLGTEYEWGGMTTEGIDCSGLVWVSYYVAGVLLPRDADQQRAMGPPVARDSLEPGDLLFFPGHVALSLGGDDYIHANGEDNGVVISSLDPDAVNYLESRDDAFEKAIRIIPRRGYEESNTNTDNSEETDS